MLYLTMHFLIPLYLPQTLIRYILKQDLPMSLEDSLTLAEAYKLPTSQINYLHLIQLIGKGKVCWWVWKNDITKFYIVYLYFNSWHVSRTFYYYLFLFADWGMHDGPEEADVCRGRNCVWTSDVLGQAAAGGQSPHIWWGEGRDNALCLK